jgi:tRNA G46 methylase TrmB
MLLDTSRAVALLLEMDAQNAAADAALLIEVATAHALCGELPEASAMLAHAIEVVASAEGGHGNHGGAVEANAGLLKRRGVPSEALRAQHSLVAHFVAAGSSSDHGLERGAMHSRFVSLPGSVYSGHGSGSGGVASAAREHLHRLVHSGRRVCVEVGAGSGDWLVAQAVAHPDVAWVAVEPQLDRVHQLWSKVALRQLANVHVCATIAEDVLGGSAPSRSSTEGWLPAQSVDAVHLRFPYPPPLELKDLEAAVPPTRGVLGGGAFLDGVLRVLRSQTGQLHVVTSEQAYCALMLALLRQHPYAAAQLWSTHGKAGFSRQTTEREQPPSLNQAHEVSFFDAALAAGGRTERCTLEYVRS